MFTGTLKKCKTTQTLTKICGANSRDLDKIAICAETMICRMVENEENVWEEVETI
jgi:hypothetical protein